MTGARWSRWAALAVAMTVGASAGAGCSLGGNDRQPLVAAASSLRSALPEVFDGHDVSLSFAGSQTVAAQVRSGAPIDLAVTADRATMSALVAEGLIDGDPVVVAHNRLAIVVPAGNPRRVEALSDLAAAGLRVVLAAPEVPVGRATRRALERVGVEIAPDSLEASVGGVVSKVTLGEADAGVAYVSDVVASDGTLHGVPVPGAPVAEYLAAVPAGAPHPAAGRRLLRRLRSVEAQRVLGRLGFDRPADEAVRAVGAAR